MICHTSTRRLGILMPLAFEGPRCLRNSVQSAHGRRSGRKRRVEHLNMYASIYVFTSTCLHLRVSIYVFTFTCLHFVLPRSFVHWIFSQPILKDTHLLTKSLPTPNSKIMAAILIHRHPASNWTTRVDITHIAGVHQDWNAVHAGPDEHFLLNGLNAMGGARPALDQIFATGAAFRIRADIKWLVERPAAQPGHYEEFWLRFAPNSCGACWRCGSAWRHLGTRAALPLRAFPRLGGRSCSQPA